ncbi:MAG: hypothetical protein ACRDLN_12655 [Solirubrobacteraceae bacterium]
MRFCAPFTHRGRCASLSAVGIAVAVGAGSGAWAKAPSGARTVAPAGNSYVAEVSGGHVALVLSRDARQVTRAFVAYTYKCNDGTSFTDFEPFKAVPMLANRTFKSSYDSGPLSSPLLPGATVQYTGSIDGKRNKLGTSVRGTARFTFVTTLPETGQVITCDTGTIRYTAKD